MRPLVLSLALFPAVAHAGDRHVGSGQAYTTISAAVTAAATGDRVLIHAGTYTENVSPVASKNLTFEGAESDRSTVVIRGTLTVPAGTWTVNNLTIDGQNARRAIYNNAGSLSVDQVTFTRGRSDSGGAVYSNAGSLTVTRCVFDANGSTSTGGAVHGNSAALVFEDTVFMSNTATNYGGAVYANAGTLRSTTTNFDANTVGYQGGGIYVYTTGLTVEGGNFTGNRATLNSGSTLGGAIFSHTAATTIRDAWFEDNYSEYDAASIDLYHTPSATVSDNTFVTNTSDFASAIEVDQANNTVISGNRFDGGSAIRGGALYLWYATNVSVLRNTFCDNNTWTGQSSAVGGTIRIAGGSGKINNNLFFAADAEDGGGGIAATDSNSFTLANNTFVDNGAGAAGAALSVENATSLTTYNNLFAWQRTTPAVYRSGGTVSVTDSWFYQNAGGDVSGTLTSSALTTGTDPGLTWGSTRPTDCVPEDFWPTWTSGLRDAGKSTIVDLDGGRSDVGFTGGPDADPALWVDADKDSVPVLWDCDDSDSARSPAKTEVCDSGDVDEDCDGLADNNDPSTANKLNLYVDDDLDGHGANSIAVVCLAPGYSTLDDDCDDTDPSAWEFLTFYKDNDGDGYGSATNKTTSACRAPAGYVDNTLDCDDADKTANIALTWYQDADGDGFGSATSTSACRAPAGYVAVTGDCDDIDPTRNPDTVWYLDADGDGLGSATSVKGCAKPDGYVTTTGDCDDTKASITTPVTWYADTDGDTYGTGAATTSCPPSTTWAARAGDCDDQDAALNPNTTWYTDEDRDGYGLTSLTIRACAPAGPYSRAAGDCDDVAPDVHPGAGEVCNRIDDDCDALIDDLDPDLDPTSASAWYLDADHDGHGAGAASHTCGPAADHVASHDDCNDAASAVFPGAPEQCNGADDDCDNQIDESVTTSDWWKDTDGDGYGSGASKADCKAPAGGYVLQSGDCNEKDNTVHPSAVESCDHVDEDCDGEVDEDAVDAATWYADTDLDGYGNVTEPIVSCSEPPYATVDDTDCDDDDNDRFPGADEVCDGVDQDCDGDVDEAAVDATSWYADVDGDTYGDGAATVACAVPDAAPRAGDCRPADPYSYPGAAEQCDGLDNDCDTQVDESVADQDWHPDSDDDGYGDPDITVTDCAQPTGHLLDASDCDDGASGIHPGATDVPDNGVDEDCDGRDAAEPDDTGIVDTDTGVVDTDTDPVDTDTDPVDTDTDTDPVDTDAGPGRPGAEDTGATPPTGEGCDCDHRGAGPSLAWLGVIGAALLRRRARHVT